ncbi:hypothetical protein DWX43_22890 [Clostridium sp. AF19-22AC]|jgi:hypothetical protein|uniref:hypothetical protein n=1 Tax=Clostridia TaxID=186801 RepID=UPI000E4A78FE|nr:MULTISPECIES: hypothetical protein [Clostridia]RHR21862.1 hypothetical protein DWX43_22890 [Clostridium sp. AF19-22AC]
MKKRSTFLKVVSIILIVFGALGLLSGIFSIAMRGTFEQTYAAMGIDIPSTFSYVLTIVGAAIIIISGIMGVIYKSKQSVLIMAVILAAYYIANIIYSSVTVGFSYLNLIGLLWPILYFWGWYQSN